MDALVVEAAAAEDGCEVLISPSNCSSSSVVRSPTLSLSTSSASFASYAAVERSSFESAMSTAGRRESEIGAAGAKIASRWWAAGEASCAQARWSLLASSHNHVRPTTRLVASHEPARRLPRSLAPRAAIAKRPNSDRRQRCSSDTKWDTQHTMR
jgi:hypothetical protein